MLELVIAHTSQNLWDPHGGFNPFMLPYSCPIVDTFLCCDADGWKIKCIYLLTKQYFVTVFY